ncbi:hypothetical protein [Mesorhizobium sophorae]|uniref:hypothetical protein n=1 Tax=Mesorhizobium sophorae TaxID=1300294 RepID=UPI000BA3F23C|nr:hypothetical protein [Mesorhizobium sophorae]
MFAAIVSAGIVGSRGSAFASLQNVWRGAWGLALQDFIAAKKSICRMCGIDSVEPSKAGDPACD